MVFASEPPPLPRVLQQLPGRGPEWGEGAACFTHEEVVPSHAALQHLCMATVPSSSVEAAATAAGSGCRSERVGEDEGGASRAAASGLERRRPPEGGPRIVELTMTHRYRTKFVTTALVTMR